MGGAFGASSNCAYELRGMNLKFNLKKCGLAKTSINILGHVMSREGI
jgi:hypothetical protein